MLIAVRIKRKYDQELYTHACIWKTFIQAKNICMGEHEIFWSLVLDLLVTVSRLLHEQTDLPCTLSDYFWKSFCVYVESKNFTCKSLYLLFESLQCEYRVRDSFSRVKLNVYAWNLNSRVKYDMYVENFMWNFLRMRKIKVI